jgi:phosphosulfolactate phosphohydrolase-like enzyme
MRRPQQLHPAVERIGKSFRVVGMSTPSVVAHKARMVFSPNAVGEKVAVVVADAIRCSSTILAAFAAGAEAMTIQVKGGRGTTPEQASSVASVLGLETVIAGELNGRPIPGGVMGNSPREADPNAIRGKLVAFSSTNLGATFWEVMSWADNFITEGGVVTTVIASFANVTTVVKWLRHQDFDRIAIATGGFYDVASQEDMVVGGDIIAGLGLPVSALDDEARVMIGAASATSEPAIRVETFVSNWIGRSLKHFGMEKDIAAAVVGTGMEPKIWRSMQHQLPIVERIAGVPVILPFHKYPRYETSSLRQVLHSLNTPRKGEHQHEARN